MATLTLSFRSKLWGTLGLILLGVATVAGIASVRLLQLRGEWQQFQDVTLAKQRAASAAYVKVGDATQEFNHFLLRGEDHQKRFAESIGNVDQQMAEYRRLGSLSQAEDEILADIVEATKGYRAGMAKAVEMKADGMLVSAIDGEVRGLEVPVAQGLENLLWSAAEAAKEKGEVITNLVKTTLAVLVVIAVVVILAGVVIATLLVRGVTRPLNQAVGVAQDVAAGRLDRKFAVHGNDETGQLLAALADMTTKLNALVTEIREVSHAVAGAADEIASGNADLSQRTAAQAASVESTASTMEELTATVKHNADNANQANKLAASASEVAVRGGKVMGEVVVTMQEIHTGATKIVDIIGTIDSLAFQTNLLALNAAVEAARAGEQGRGFAVVASEVRALAQRSAAAAQEIKTLINSAVSSVGAGTKRVSEAGKTMEDVVAAVQRVTAIMTEISSATQEQRSGIEQVNEAISRMDEVSQQNAALVEEEAAAAKSLDDLAHQLLRAIGAFGSGSVAAASGADAVATKALPPAGTRQPSLPAPAATADTVMETAD